MLLVAPVIATVTVAGDPASLQGYRLRVRELLVSEGVDDYRELHTIDKLDWRFKFKGGVPFPAFVDSSIAFPDLQVHVEWIRSGEGQRGVAIIQNGSVTQQRVTADDTDGRDQACYDLQVKADGRLTLALAARGWRKDELIGYALSADQHAWFHLCRNGADVTLTTSDGMEAEWAERWIVAGGHAQYAELGDREPIETRLRQELERLSTGLSAEWIWFAASPPEETIVERQRYEQSGLTVHEANVRSVKLRKVMQPRDDGGFVLAAERADVIEAREMLLRCWAQGN